MKESDKPSHYTGNVKTTTEGTGRSENPSPLFRLEMDGAG